MDLNIHDWDEDYDYCFCILEDVHYEVMKEALGPRRTYDGKLGWVISTLNGLVTVFPDYSQLSEDVQTWHLNSDATGTSDDPGNAVGDVLDKIRSTVEHRELAHKLAVSQAAERVAKINEGVNRRLADQ